MKKLALIAFLAVLPYSMLAQIKTPQPSPAAKIEQAVGLTDVVVEYSRPGMRDRAIFGNLVPYGKIWRTGANANTKITFSDDITVDGQTVKAGAYAIYTKPSEKTWEVMFYSDSDNWGTPKTWDDSKVAARVTAKVQPMPMNIESFTIIIDDLHNNGATLGILWENVYVGVDFEVPTVDKAVASIESVMSGPTAREYYSAASYYHEEGKDLNKAKEWIDKAVALDTENSMYWVLRRQSLIYAKLGDKKGAIQAAKTSLTAAEKADNQDYVKLNKDSLKEWGAL